ncbi:hypothetical protein GGP94_003044 [Salinibacter ruber]|uniref:hypothetical protein n=1 Tax=Salinibacter ruber TaxID=146919 RepID=UPI002166EB8E|nr:hypothetical protein [Salinibacter ruber]MCS4162599.1 hypothetical protein [Salinibacter ruber]
MSMSLRSARSKATKAEKRSNWRDYIRAQYDIAGFLHQQGDTRDAKERFIRAMIAGLQGPENMGHVDKKDKDIYEPFLGISPLPPSKARKKQFAEILSEREIESIYESISLEVWREDFERGKSEILKDIKKEIREAKESNKRLMLDREGEYEYPHSISMHGKYPTEEGLSGKFKKERLEWIEKSRSKRGSRFEEWVDDKFDKDMLSDIIKYKSSKHGIFVMHYFKEEIQSIVKKNSEEENLDYLKKILSEVLYEEKESSLDLFKKEPPKKIIENNIFDITFHKNKDFVSSAAADWLKENSNKKNCEICGKEFRVIDIPDWLYRGSGEMRNCCFMCPIMEFPKGEDLRQAIRDFVDECGFVPKSDFGISSHSFMSRLDESKKIPVTKKFAQMGGSVNISRNFGSWFEALEKSDALPEGFRYSGTGVWCLADDGHECHSLAEQRIDNWLHDHNIDHKREPKYPEDKKLNSSGRRKADWLIEETGAYVEFFGMKGNDEYDLKTEQKKRVAEKNDIELISIYPSDLESLDSVLGDLAS